MAPRSHLGRFQRPPTNPSNVYPLKTLRRLGWACALYALCFAVHAQGWVPVAAVATGKVTQASLAQTGQVVLLDGRGTLRQYDATGTLLATFAPDKTAMPALLEAWNPLQTFLFYRDFQEFLFLDRFLNAAPRYPLTTPANGFVQLATPAADGRLWLFDNAAFVLRKFDPASRATVTDAPLDLQLLGDSYEVNFMREYQNQLFVNNRQRTILVFDGFGNYRKQLPLATEWFGFLDSELYCFTEGQIHLFNLYTWQERTLLLPALTGVRQVLLSRAYLYLLTDERMFIYRGPV